MTRIRVKEPVEVNECFGEWSGWEYMPPSLEGGPDEPLVRNRSMRDYILNPGEYEIESISSPAVEYHDGSGIGSWLVLKGTMIGASDWISFIKEGKVEVLA